MGETLVEKGNLEGHGGWVTAIATTNEAPDMVLSASRDRSIIMWNIIRKHDKYGFPQKRLKGHSHFVQDVAISSDGQFALSGSWDGTLRLWDLNSGRTTRRFVGHTKDVLSVAFSADNRQIVSGSRDKTINLWNTLGQCKYTITENGHKAWVSCVRFSPQVQDPLIVSAGWDKVVKVWNLNHCNLRTNLSSLDAGDIIHALVFGPIRYWLCAATASTIKIWDLESKQCVADLAPEDMQEMSKKAVPIQCISLTWSADGGTLYGGYTDNIIRVWQVDGT